MNKTLKKQIDKVSLARIIVAAKQMSGINNMEEDDIKMMVDLLSEELRHPKYSALSVNELIFAVKEGCCYRYGDYGAISFGRIVNWIDKYLASDDRRRCLEERCRVNGLLEEHRPSEEEMELSYKEGINKEYSIFLKSQDSYSLMSLIKDIYMKIIRRNGMAASTDETIIDVFRRYQEEGKELIFDLK